MPRFVPPLETLNRKGWQVTPLQDGWCLRQREGGPVIYLSLTPRWCCLASPLPSQAGVEASDLAEQTRFYRQLLQANGQMFLIKYGLDVQNRLCKLVEIPGNQSISAFLFEWALDGLTRSNMNMSTLAVRVLDPSEGLSRETLLFYLKTISLRGWIRYKFIAERNIWWLHYYRNRFHKWDVYLRITRTWICFEIPILEEGASVLYAAPLAQKAFLEYLLRLNAHFFLARLSVTEGGQVLLLLEIPTEILDLNLFQLVMLTLENYVKGYFREILLMASLEKDDQLFKLLMQPTV